MRGEDPDVRATAVEALGDIGDSRSINIMSVALLFAWLPFGKLAHTFLLFFARGTTGAVLGRRGART